MRLLNVLNMWFSHWNSWNSWKQTRVPAIHQPIFLVLLNLNLERPKFGLCRCYKDIPPMVVPNEAHRKDIPNIPLQPCHSVIFLSWKELALGLMVSNPSENSMTHPLKYRWSYTNWKTFRCFGVAVTQAVPVCVFFKKKWIIYMHIYIYNYIEFTKYSYPLQGSVKTLVPTNVFTQKNG